MGTSTVLEYGPTDIAFRISRAKNYGKLLSPKFIEWTGALRLVQALRGYLLEARPDFPLFLPYFCNSQWPNTVFGKFCATVRVLVVLSVVVPRYQTTEHLTK